MGFAVAVEQWRGLVKKYQAMTPDTPNVNQILAQMQQESAGDPKAKSGASCYGLMQIAPSTALDMGMKPGGNLFDPETNIQYATLYLGWLSRYVQRHWPVTAPLLRWQMVLACYNGGIGNFAKYQGFPPFWETLDYVRKITLFYFALSPAGDAMSETTPPIGEPTTPPPDKITDPPPPPTPAPTPEIPPAP